MHLLVVILFICLAQSCCAYAVRTRFRQWHERFGINGGDCQNQVHTASSYKNAQTRTWPRPSQHTKTLSSMLLLLNPASCARKLRTSVPHARSRIQFAQHAVTKLPSPFIIRAARQGPRQHGVTCLMVETSKVSDAPDMAGQTICHWSETVGETRWALVEPDLATLQREQNQLAGKVQQFQDKVNAIRALQRELNDIIAKDVQAFFKKADTDLSGSLSYVEWEQACSAAVGSVDPSVLQKLFDEMDFNGDGTISWSEFTLLRNQLVASRDELEQQKLQIDMYQPEEHAPECIAEGGQGMILVGKDLETGDRVAIKVERVQGESGSALKREADVLRALREETGFPSVLHFGRQMLNSNPSSTDCLVMVMDLLGSSIRSLWWENTRGSKGFQAGTALSVAVRMLDLLEKLHSKGFIHRDVKLANFVMSGKGGNDKGELCLIDFGITVRFDEEQVKAQRDSKSSSLVAPQFFGSRDFASRAAHRGDAQSYSDDIESLVYVLSYMLKGAVPWGELNSYGPVGSMKAAAVEAIVAGRCDTNGKWQSGEPCSLMLCADGPCATVIQELLTHVDSLEFGEKPDYASCRTALMKAYAAVTGREKLADEYDWNNPASPVKGQPRRSTSGSDFFDIF